MTGSYEEVRLVKFHTPALLSEREQAAARRRFCTLLVPPQKGGFGGNAYVRRVQSGDRAFELALKMPRPDAQPEQEQLNRETLEEEYRTLSVVSNLRGFPDVYGFGYTADGTPALLMEWVDGVSLLDARPALSDGAESCPGDIVAALGLSVLKIILSTQSLDTPFVHRDLSMRNIMLRHDRIPLEEQVSSGYFDICLIDMGSAKLVKPDFSFTVDVNAFRGATPAYAAPEMLERFKADPGARDNPAVDIYALGSILYELYCGHAPLEAELRRSGDHARLKRAVQPQPLAPATPREQGLVNAIMACLAVSQDARPSANELAARLEPFARTGAPRKHRPWRIAAALPCGRTPPSPPHGCTGAARASANPIHRDGPQRRVHASRTPCRQTSTLDGTRDGDCCPGSNRGHTRPRICRHALAGGDAKVSS